MIGRICIDIITYSYTSTQIKVRNAVIDAEGSEIQILMVG